MNISDKTLENLKYSAIVLVGLLALWGVINIYWSITEDDPFTPVEVGKAVGFCVDREGSDAVRYCGCLHSAQVAAGLKPSDVGYFGLSTPKADAIAEESLKTCASLRPGA
jgi:hypothetical protein